METEEDNQVAVPKANAMVDNFAWLLLLARVYLITSTRLLHYTSKFFKDGREDVKDVGKKRKRLYQELHELLKKEQILPQLSSPFFNTLD